MMNIWTWYLGLVRRARCNKLSELPFVFLLSFIRFAPRCDVEETNQNYLSNTSAEKERVQSEKPVYSICRGQI